MTVVGLAFLGFKCSETEPSTQNEVLEMIKTLSSRQKSTVFNKLWFDLQ